MSIESTVLHIKMEPEDLQIYDCGHEPDQINIQDTTTPTVDLKQNLNDFGTAAVQCIHCTQQLPSIDRLHIHQSSGALGKTHCDQCNLSFPSRNCFTHHQDVEHVASAPKTCPACPALTFHSTRKWSIHQHTIHSIYECDVCEAQFPSSYRLKEHKAIHFTRPKRTKSAPTKNFQCVYCKRQFDKLYKVKQHQSVQWVGTKRCADCTFEFPSRMCYIEHRDLVHLATNPMRCAECPSLSFDTTIKWQRHQRNVHSAFECCECDAILPSKSRMKNHKQQHSHVALRTCVKCNIVMASVTRLAEHTAMVHARDPAKCTHCDRTFANQSRLKRHIQLAHVGGSNCECDICGDPFRSSYYLRLHMARFHNPDEPFQCDGCLRRFATDQQLTLHRKHRCKANQAPSPALGALPSTQLANGPSELVPPTVLASAPDEIRFELVRCDAPPDFAPPPIADTSAESQSLQCVYCQKPFNSLGQLQAHLKSITNSSAYSCDKCRRSFPSLDCTTHHKCAIHLVQVQESSRNALKLVRRRGKLSSVADCKPPVDSAFADTADELLVLVTAKRRFECIYCKRTFRLLDELRGHIKTATTHAWMCLPCNRRFATKNCMARHVDTVHLAIAPIVCSECPRRRFRQLHRWSAHRRNVHSLYDCCMCYVTFSTQHHLQTHYNVQHRDVAFVAQCEFCAKIYSTAKALRCHIRRVHKRREQGVCDRCQRTFTSKQSLQDHVLLRHNPSSAFGCDRCLCSFATQKEFDRHLTFRGCRMVLLKSAT